MSPCHDCPYRKPVCHDYCREYLVWHEDQLARKRKAKIDKILDGIYEWMLERETR